MKNFKLLVITVFVAFVWMTFGRVYAATQEDFTLTVLKDNNPVREFSNQVAIPFDTEYKLRLKNDNRQRCSATVWIDGAKVSEMGNFIINGNDFLDLERFLNESLTEGKRFKFVPLDHPSVDDPNRIENGIIKVEFRLEKVQYIQQIEREYFWPEDQYPLLQPGYGDLIMEWAPGENWVIDSDTITTLGIDLDNYTMELDSNSILVSNTSAGATIPGSYSDQSFYKVDFDGEDKTVVIQLKMVGI